MSTIQILTPTEIRNYESPPHFDSFSRKKFFTLPIGITNEVENLRTSHSQIAFVLQVGYFRASNRFFGNRFYQADIALVAGRLSLPIPVSLEIPKQIVVRHRQIIAEFYGFRSLTKIDKEQLISETADLVKQFHRPAEVFRQTLRKLNSRKFVLPGYDFLATIISREIYQRKLALSRIINESLSMEQKQLLDSLFEKEESIPEDNTGFNSIAVAFGNNQEFSEGDKQMQDIIANSRRLIENMIICWNYLCLTQKLTEMTSENEKQALLKTFKNSSIITWQHINFHGEYDFSKEKTKDSIGFDLPKILSWKPEENGNR